MRTEKPNPPFVIRNLKFVIVLAAADEMHNLDFIGIFDQNRFPILFPHDFFVKFDGDALLREREIFEQLN